MDADVYRPMVINATLTMLVKTDAPEGMGNDSTYYVSGEDKYYRIDGNVYRAISTGDAAAAITATNVRRSNLNLTKKVVDEANNSVTSADLFEFTITVNNERDTEVWFSVQRDASDPATVVKDLITSATAEVKDGVPTGYYYAASKSPITVSIRPGWNLRFTNMPNGTTFTIKENLTSGSDYTFVSAAIDNEGEFSVTEGTTTGNGTIKESNKQYTVTYTNKAEAKQVYIKKTGRDGAVQLAGAVFNLYTKADYEATPRGGPVKAGLTSKTDSLIDLGKLPVGTYYLEETDAPVGYNRLTEPVEIVVGTDVTYTQSENTLPPSHGGIEYDSTTKTYTLTVTNSAGYELPSTGGPGTLGYTLTGALLILAAALLLLRRRTE